MTTVETEHRDNEIEHDGPVSMEESVLKSASNNVATLVARETDNDAASESSPLNRLSLIVLAGSNVGQVFSLGPGLSILGRDDEADIQITDGGISRRHISIDIDQVKAILRDLGSLNGTKINGKRVFQSTKLATGDKIQLGPRTVFRVSHPDDLETRYAEKMYHAALRDELTGVFNRRYFEQRLTSELAFSSRHNAPVSLVVADIDHFKRINDTYGHPIGDRVLRGVAALISTTLREEDVVARYGGEEFVIICRKTGAAEATTVAERVRSAVEDERFSLSNVALTLTLSCGVADVLDCAAQDVGTLLNAADEALYQAKRLGRNKVVCAPRKKLTS